MPFSGKREAMLVPPILLIRILVVIIVEMSADFMVRHCNVALVTLEREVPSQLGYHVKVPDSGWNCKVVSAKP